MISALLSLLLTPLDYLAACYLVARGRSLAPAPAPPPWLRDFERAPAEHGPATCANGCACPNCRAGNCAKCERVYGCNQAPIAAPVDPCPHCGFGPDLCPPGSRDDCATYHSLPTHGDVLAMPGHLEAERREHSSEPPPVACCYCGAKCDEPTRRGCYTDPEDDDSEWLPLCNPCATAKTPTADQVRAKVAADRIAAAALPHCGVRECKIDGCQR